MSTAETPQPAAQLPACPAIITAAILAFVVIRLAPYMQIESFDFVQHYMLVDEIMKQGLVRQPPDPALSYMAPYPPVAHWLAAIVGWVGGSGIAGMLIVNVAALFTVYVLMARLVGLDSLWRIALAVLGFWLLRSTHALVGWEVVGNFFYPQLVGNVVYFGLLLWACRDPSRLRLAGVFLAVAFAAMWLQPLTSIHVLGAGGVLLTYRAAKDVFQRRKFKPADAAWPAVYLIVAALVFTQHPMFDFMRMVSQNDGGLVFSTSHIHLIAVLCLAFGLANLYRALTNKPGAAQADVVLGCALVAAIALQFMQSAAVNFLGVGSDYAVKKHFFLVLTLGLLNAIRLIAAFLPPLRMTAPGPLLAPLVAGAATMVILSSYTVPIAPAIRALAYAESAVANGFAGFKPGNTVATDPSLPGLVNAIITQVAFRHPQDEDITKWWMTQTPPPGMEYVMVRRSATLGEACDKRSSESARFVIVPTSCLKVYVPGRTIDFTAGGTGSTYAGRGWSTPEPGGTWTLGTDGANVELKLRPTDKGPFKLVVVGGALVGGAKPQQTVVVEINDTNVATWTYTAADSPSERTAIIPAAAVKDQTVNIRLRVSGAISPAKLLGTTDMRELGLMVKTLALVPMD